MKSINVKGTLRTEVGKKATKQLRKDGLVPCNLYGGGKNVSFIVPENDLRHIIYTPHIYVVVLDIEGTEYKSIIKEFQFHPVKDNVLHIDFLEVTEKEPIEIKMPTLFEGNSKGVKDGGKLFINRRKMLVRGLIKNIPETLNIDVTELSIGKSIQIKDLDFENLELIGPARGVVCTVAMSRNAISETASEEEGEEGEEGTEGEEATEGSAEAKEGSEEAKSE